MTRRRIVFNKVCSNIIIVIIIYFVYILHSDFNFRLIVD